jgi:carboxysome shell carbonic anhydrase
MRRLGGPAAPRANAAFSRQVQRAARWSAPAGQLAPSANAGTDHVLADATLSAALRSRAAEIEAAFDAIEPALRAIAPLQFESDFLERAKAHLRAALALDVASEELHAAWNAPLDIPKLYAHCVLETFSRLVDRAFDRSLARLSDGEDAQTLIHRWGYHAVDISPCADGRLSGVVDYILRVPPAVVTARTPYAGALFDVEESLQHWERVELGRWREGRPNAAGAQTTYLKIGVYHFSSGDPQHEGCAAHGHSGTRAAEALLTRLDGFATAVERSHGGARVSTLLVGVDTDNDAIRVHVPDVSGTMRVDRFVDNSSLYEQTRNLERAVAKETIREAVAACAGVAADDPASEGMRWFCGYLLKNNIGQIDAVRVWHGGSYTDRGHTERIVLVGDALDDVQLRNLAFQAQMETVEEGSGDLDIGMRIVRGLHEPRGLAVPVLVHMRYDARVPGSRERARVRALRLRGAIHARYAPLGAKLHVHAVVRPGDGGPVERVEPNVAGSENGS